MVLKERRWFESKHVVQCHACSMDGAGQVAGGHRRYIGRGPRSSADYPGFIRPPPGSHALQLCVAPHSRFAKVQSDLPCAGLVTLERPPPHRLLVLEGGFYLVAGDETGRKTYRLSSWWEEMSRSSASQGFRDFARFGRVGGGGGVERTQLRVMECWQAARGAHG